MKIISKIILLGALLPIFVNATEVRNINSPFSAESLEQKENTIIEARSKLSRIVSTMPDKRYKAVAFFERDMQVEEAIESIKSQDITITGFRHGTPDNSGGYMMGENETIEEALANYRRDHVLFLERDAEFSQSVLNDPQSDADVKRAMSARLRKIHLRQADYVDRGLRIIGLEVSGASAELSKAWNSNPNSIRVLELVDGKPVPNKFDIQ
ncbi:hypothetical protein ACFOZ5_01170 [Marinobacter lacisalsi]|uniref:Uncharacterized protein n=1 Tax=Marinobacter lacisalsi TaxID=475979 RepID=A0ABV8QCL9_9GAMM